MKNECCLLGVSVIILLRTQRYKPLECLNINSGEKKTELCNIFNTGWRTKCHTIDCAHNTFLLLQKYLTSGTELILIGWKIFPNEELVQCDLRFASQPLANEPLHSSQLFRHKSSESARHNFTMWALSCTTFSPLEARKGQKM